MEVHYGAHVNCLNLLPNGVMATHRTILDDGPRGLESLRLISAACGGTKVIARLDLDFRTLCRDPDNTLQIEVVLALFSPYEAGRREQGPTTIGVRMNAWGEITALRRGEFELLQPEGRSRTAKTGLGSSAFFLLGYGSRAASHEGTDDFDFNDLYFRLKRVESLFDSRARLTDPVEFLTRLHYRGIRCKRVATGHVLHRLASLFREQMDIDSGGWLDRDCNFGRA